MFQIDFPFIRMVILIQHLVKKWVEILGQYFGQKMGQYFGLLTDVKKSLRNVKHRSGILSTRSIISDHQNYISLLIYGRKVEKM